MIKGFKNFLLRGDVVVIAVGLVIALAFSRLVTAFTSNIINPIVARFQGGNSNGLGVNIGKNQATFVNFGALISAIIYFIIFMAVIYLVLVVPYRSYMAKRGSSVFGDPAPTQTCPACLSSDLPVGATKCKYCATDIPTAAASDS
jgi:large conductance mechanosensitive channel